MTFAAFLQSLARLGRLYYKTNTNAADSRTPRRTMRKILAMLFRLTVDDNTWFDVIAWIERHGNGKHLWPYHPNKALLDVRAGDIVIFRRQQFRVLRLKPYRTSEAKDESQYSEIRCGRDWEAGG